VTVDTEAIARALAHAKERLAEHAAEVGKLEAELEQRRREDARADAWARIVLQRCAEVREPSLRGLNRAALNERARAICRVGQSSGAWGRAATWLAEIECECLLAR